MGLRLRLHVLLSCLGLHALLQDDRPELWFHEETLDPVYRMLSGSMLFILWIAVRRIQETLARLTGMERV